MMQAVSILHSQRTRYTGKHVNCLSLVVQQTGIFSVGQSWVVQQEGNGELKQGGVERDRWIGGGGLQIFTTF